MPPWPRRVRDLRARMRRRAVLCHPAANVGRKSHALRRFDPGAAPSASRRATSRDICTAPRATSRALSRRASPPKAPTSRSRYHRSIRQNRPTRREPTNLGRIQHARAPPGPRIVPASANLPLRLGIVIEVGGDEKVVVIRERIHQVLETVRFVGREQTRPNRIKRPMQRHRTRDRLPRVAALGTALCRLRGGQPEDEDIVLTDAVADLDVGAVQRADGQRAIQRQLSVARARPCRMPPYPPSRSAWTDLPRE